ncbi:MAG: hypothetical protein CMH63_02545 [Nanoarchaeota archaeon]|jgi:hypoxanthine-guanine phosphoribosyltransferase|nr:hypothetical protein [Nanoarchaeota archaeon]|tara:strand:+ start:7948 stop:8331 length:384 start_codon:yes stop_codon:yes gene_type:complete
MAKKKVSKNIIRSQTDKLLVVTIVLLSALFVMNLVSLTGYSTKFNTGQSSYYGKNTCQKVGGIIFREGVSANFNGRDVTLTATGEDMIAVTVDGKRSSIELGHEIYINGVLVTNFVSTERESCLILN